MHLGVNIKDKITNHINKEVYLSAKPEGLPGWTEEHYSRQKLKAAYNYDLNMQYFECLDKNVFVEHINECCLKSKMKECHDLNELSSVSGVYMMVLDEFKQVYIGISNDMKRRIMGHWNKRMPLEKLIFGDVCNSVLSINSFGALDTTRVFYIESTSPEKMENKILKRIDPRFSLNRTAGGIGYSDLGVLSQEFVNIEILANKRPQIMTHFADVNILKSILTESDFNFYLRKYPELKRK